MAEIFVRQAAFLPNRLSEQSQQIFIFYDSCLGFGASRRSGTRLNIDIDFPRYGDSHVKDKMVGETVLSRTPWRARQAPGV